MYLNTKSLLLVLLTASISLVTAEPRPYLAVFSASDLSLLSKRQAGYRPTQDRCKFGNTCQIACGPQFETCASTDGRLHCYDPNIKKQICCTDGTGNGCANGYYCTNDSIGRTWCCPDGMDLKACAASYGLTDSLHSQHPGPTGSVTGTGSIGPQPTNPAHNNTHGGPEPTYPYPNGSYTYGPTGVTGSGSVGLPTPTTGPSNATSTEEGTIATNTPIGPSGTGVAPPEFTGGAMGNGRAEWLLVAAGALGFAFVLGG